MQMLVNELEKGIGAPPGTGLLGPPVDLAGLGLVATDLNDVSVLLQSLTIPFTFVTGDDDWGHLTFYEQPLAPLNPLVVQEKVPLKAHGDQGIFHAWNATEQVFGQLMDRVEIQNCTPSPPSPLDIDWEVVAPNGSPYRSEQYHDAILKVDRHSGTGLRIEPGDHTGLDPGVAGS